MQHGGDKVGDFLTRAVNGTSTVFFLFTDKRTKNDKILFSIPHVQYGNLMPAVVQIAYTFTIILCQEWSRAITRKYQSTLRWSKVYPLSILVPHFLSLLTFSIILPRGWGGILKVFCRI